MVQQLYLPKLELGGTPEEQELAAQVWNLMRMQGFSYAMERPISQSLENLTTYLSEQKYKGLTQAEEIMPLLEKALSASPAVFYREEADDGTVFFKTNKKGKAGSPAGPLDQHSFKNRLKQDVQAVETPTAEELAAALEASALQAVDRPALPSVVQVKPAVALPLPTAQVTTPTPVKPVPAPAAVVAPRPATPVVTEAVSVTPAVASAPVPPATPAPAAIPVASTPTPTAAVSAPTPAATPVAPSEVVAPAPVVPRLITLPDGTVVDLSLPTNAIMQQHGPAVAAVLLKALGEDFRFVNFANDWYIDDMTGRYGKGDFRRIREFMSEVQEPVSDTAILRDVYNKRTTDNDYEATRFALNFRLFREKKDFEFVGANDDRIWTAPGVTPIGQPRRKASEIGTDYKFLEDPTQVDATELVVDGNKKRWEHVLTFYEYENGVLPYDATAKAFFPGPLFDDQKSLVLRFEATQMYVSYTAELRYPGGTRGGWIMGLESFFSNNLVPGALLIIQPGDKSNHFTIEYKQAEEQEARLLFYDDRRQKFVFRPIVFECSINKELTLSSERFGRLEGQRRLEENERKKTDLIVANAFEYAGQKQPDGGYLALLDDLYPLVNIERPFSRAYLQHLLTAGNNQFRPDESTPDAFFYKPAGRR